nr:conjugal transfer protein TraG N-terminal domain-containing protein [Nitrincola nitratireducens]
MKFWWELARWLNSHMVDLIYRSEAAKLSFMAGINNVYDRGVMMFVEWSMFFIFPMLWVGVLSWAGMSVGSAVQSSLSNSTQIAQSAGSEGGNKLQGAATKMARK